MSTWCEQDTGRSVWNLGSSCAPVIRKYFWSVSNSGKSITTVSFFENLWQPPITCRKPSSPSLEKTHILLRCVYSHCILVFTVLSIFECRHCSVYAKLDWKVFLLPFTLHLAQYSSYMEYSISRGFGHYLTLSCEKYYASW